MNLNLSEVNIKILGQMLIKRRPDIANELLQERINMLNSSVHDTSLIDYYFESFCLEVKIDKNNLQSPSRNRIYTKKIKEFIGLVIKIYHPYVFEKKCIYFKPKQGLITALSITLKMNKGNVSNAVQDACKWIDLYEDFRTSINDLHSRIICGK